MELTYRALEAGFRVEEVPIVFSERRRGESKMSRRIMLEAISMIPRLRLEPEDDRSLDSRKLFRTVFDVF